MRVRKVVILSIISAFLSCKHENNIEFKEYVDGLIQIKTPLRFVDSKELIPIIGSHNQSLDVLFFTKGFVPVGKIQETKNSVSLLFIEPGVKNEIHIKTFDFNGRELESYKLDKKWGKINDSTTTKGFYNLKNRNTLFRSDSTIQDYFDGEGNEILVNWWNNDTIIIYPNSKLKKP